ncbi:hypothetical protein BIY29_18685 [Brenneria alni]|uniref:CopG family transcriptional regulator n=1 Tax=Brenneria alni TaxID=71656 RepID=A0A421DJB5_9GAMM|nr:DUF1778 domain-containing protein [Brenneria alni]RLM18072.1 hypothetical protein BIY29_18685 [Brenneria alni]
MKTETKEAPINIRAKHSQRELIDLAARLRCKSRTDFILEAACREAEEAILEKHLFVLTEQQFTDFIYMLDNQADAYNNVQRVLERKSPWE